MSQNSPSDPTNGPPLPLKARLGVLWGRWEALPGNLRGSAWLVCSTLILVVMASMIKYVGQHLPVVEILFIRQMMVIVVISPAIVKGFPAIFRTTRLKLHMVRVCLSSVAMMTGFTAIVYLPLAEVTAIGFARTLFTTILAVFILHEIVGWRRWSATIVGLIGVLIILRPSPEGLNEYALLALLSAFFVACIMIVLRLLSQTEKPTTIMAYQSVFLAIAFAPFAIYYWVTPTMEELGLLVIIGILMSAGQWSNIQAYKAGEASAIAPFEYGRLLFATLIGIWYFGEIPTEYTLIGAAVIVASTLYTAHRNAKKKAPATKADHGDAP
jgi:drug/metabolite transporter (DMT)-like permease